MLRNLAPDMDPGVVAAIDARLDGVARDHGVAVPWAIESGSRAWGFPSPDSDYDCRFLFVRPAAAYAGPWRPRDVIETPLDAVLDVNGWDLVKAVKLVVSGNATVGEWLRSPLVYAGEPAFRSALLAHVEEVADPAATARHYLHVGRQQWVRSKAEAGEPVKLKTVFYALRPAATLHWISTHPGVPPMNLQDLLDEAPPAADVRDAVAELVAQKAVTRELGAGAVPLPVRQFVTAQLEHADATLVPMPVRDPAEARHVATERFIALVDRWAPA